MSIKNTSAVLTERLKQSDKSDSKPNVAPKKEAPKGGSAISVPGDVEKKPVVPAKA